MDSQESTQLIYKKFTTQLLRSNFFSRYIARMRYNKFFNFIEYYYTQLRAFLNTNMKQELYKTIFNKFKNNDKVLFFNNKLFDKMSDEENKK